MQKGSQMTEQQLACAEPRYLPATDAKTRQHLIFSSLDLELLIYHFKKVMLPSTVFRLLDDVILRSYCSVALDTKKL